MSLDPEVTFSANPENGANSSLLAPDTIVSSPITEPAPVITNGKTFMNRVGSYLIDYFIIYLMSFAAGLFSTSILYFFVHAQGKTLVYSGNKTASLSDFLFIAVLAEMTYFILFEWLFFATPGKAIRKYQVVKMDGSRPDVLAVIGRYIARIFDGLFWGLVANESMKKSPLHQRYGDKWAHTVVVDRYDPAVKERRPWKTFWIVLIATFLIISFFSLIYTLGEFSISSPLSSVPAADINLQAIGDVDSDYELVEETGKEDLEEDSVYTDVSTRAFFSESAWIQTSVYVFPVVISDSPSNVIDEIVEASKEDDPDDFLNGPVESVSIGDRASIVEFYQPSYEFGGYILVVVKGNVLVRVECGGDFSRENVLSLAETIVKRIK